MATRGTITKYVDKTGRSRWRFRLDIVGGRGQRRQVKRQGFATRHQAATALELVAAQNAGVTARTTDTLHTYLHRWATQRGEVDQIRASTVASYLSKLKHLQHRRPALLLTDTRPEHLTGLYAEMRREGLGPRTVRYLHVIIRKGLDDAVRQGLLGANPAAAAMPPSAKAAAAPERTIWTEAEGRRFANWTGVPDNRRACWMLALNTGLRRGELAGLQWADIEDDTMRIERSRVTVNSRTETAKPKTERSRRTVVLSPDTVTAVKSWRVKQAETFLSIGLGGGAVWFATNAKLRPSPPDDLSHRWKHDATAALQAGIVDSYMTLHDARHWHASQLVAAGVDMRTIADRLGHVDPGFTLRTYGHSDLERQRTAAAQLDAG